ncbi:MAG TPA: hypothetical protein VFH80_25910 [Solirubrobacteraceae bacterium]|nr:hypothetical protein [Solirubrobacteraceae bacterium]
MLLRNNRAITAEPAVWTASAWLDHDPNGVLGALTDPAAIARWAPVTFEVDGLAGRRLAAGSRERVSGSIAGIGATFDVQVIRADTNGLELVADGPISLDVNYSFIEHDDGVSVHARVGIRRRRGLSAQLLQAAVAALLNAGALARALRKLEHSLDAPAPRAPFAHGQPKLAAA